MEYCQKKSGYAEYCAPPQFKCIANDNKSGHGSGAPCSTLQPFPFCQIFSVAAQSDEQLYNLSANDKNDTVRVYPDI